MKNNIILTIVLLGLSVSSQCQQSISSEKILSILKEGGDCNIVDKEILGILDLTELSKYTIDIENAKNGKPTSTTIVKKNNGKRDTTYTHRKNVDNKIEGILKFTNCVFTDEIRTNKTIGLSDGNRQIVVSVYSSFEEKIIFNNCIFKKNLLFSASKFEDEVIFQNCKFKNEVDFSRAKFLGMVSFEESTFQDEVIFDKAKFCKELNLTDTHFKRHASFNRAIFKVMPNFFSAEIRRKLSLEGASLNDEPLSWVIKDNRANYSKEQLLKLKFIEDFYPTIINLKEGVKIETTKGIWQNGGINASIVNLWDARVTINSSDGKWVVEGRIKWHKKDNYLIADHAVISSPDGDILFENNKLVKVPLSNPANFEIQE